MLTSGMVVVERQGPPEITEALVEGLRLQWSFGFPYTPKELPVLTHAFFPYPAGMQPATAHHLLDTVLPGKSVLDPFVGGGTVVVEALRAGRLGVGSDVSPLSLFVSRRRSWTASDSELEELREASRSICAAAAAKLADAHTRQVSGTDWDCISTEITDYSTARAADGLRDELMDALWFILAVARPKAAKKRHGVDRVVACEFFHSVCVEYTKAVKKLTMVATASSAPFLPQRPLLLHRDARQPLVFGVEGQENTDRGSDTLAYLEDNSAVSDNEDGPNNVRFHAVLTSPPYPGVYDYLAHARQTRSMMGCVRNVEKSSSIFLNGRVPTGRNWADEWLSGEIGSKSMTRRERKKQWEREAASRDEHTSGEVKWESDQRAWLLATTIALKVGGRMGVMIGDGDGVDTRSSLLNTVDLLRTQDGSATLRVLGWATLRSAEGAKRRMRTEHIVLLEKLHNCA